MSGVLVIKHGALGDIVLASGAFQAIRQRHPTAEITLLTTAPFDRLLAPSGWFDRFWLDRRKPSWRADLFLQTAFKLRQARFKRVYDLQNSSRSSAYFRWLASPKPEWSGIAPGCSHPDLQPERLTIHTVPRLANQLAAAGVEDVPLPALPFLKGDLSSFDLPERFALMVPGGAPHRSDKRWPAERYGELAVALAEWGLLSLLIGTAAEADALAAIQARCPSALNLGGHTDFGQIAALARRARFAVGNDTGPMHLAAAAGATVLTLFSKASDPERTRPGWPDALWLRRDRLDELEVSEVIDALRPLA